MKIRNGFVSNSSSASFIVKWKQKGEKFVSTNQALKRLLDICSINDKYPYPQTEHGKWEKWDNVTQVEFEELYEASSLTSDGCVETNFYTTMHSSHRSFGDLCMLLTGSLTMSSDTFEIVYQKIERY